MKEGIYNDLSNEKYHTAPGISKSGLDLINKCPALYKARYLEGFKFEPTPAMVTGSAVHKAVLEPDSFSDEFVFAPEINRRTKAGKAEYAEFVADNKGKTVLPKEDYAKVMCISDAVISHPIASDIFSDGQPETSIFHKDENTGAMVKVRPDWITEDIVVDLKTTSDASPEAFSKSCYNFRYYVQAAMYKTVANAAFNGRFSNFVFVCVETKEPYQLAVYVADEEMMDLGREAYRRDLAVYVECMAGDTWPGYNQNKISTISLPGWARHILEV